MSGMRSLLVLSDGDFPDEAARALLLAGGVEPRAQAGAPDAVLIVHRLPAAQLLERARALQTDAPVIVAVERAEVAAVPPGKGADDLIVRPIDAAELLVRVRFQIWRRQRGPSGEEGIVRAGEDLTIDTTRYEVTLAGRRVDLTLKEYELLLFLARHPGRVFTREALLDRIWGARYFGGTRTVDVHVRRLRMKLERGGRAFIDTVRGVGYRLQG